MRHFERVRTVPVLTMQLARNNECRLQNAQRPPRRGFRYHARRTPTPRATGSRRSRETAYLHRISTLQIRGYLSTGQKRELTLRAAERVLITEHSYPLGKVENDTFDDAETLDVCYARGSTSQEREVSEFELRECETSS